MNKTMKKPKITGQKDSVFTSFLVLLFVSFIFSIDILISKEMAILVPAEPILAILIFIMVSRFLLQRGEFYIPKSKLLTISIFFFLYSFLNVLFSKHIFVSGKAFTRETLYFIAIFLGMIIFLRKNRDIKNLIDVLMGIGLIFAVWGIYQQVSGPLQNYAILGAPFFDEHGSYGAYMSFLFSFALAFFLYGKNKHSRVIFFVLMVLFLGAVIFSFAKGAWVSIIGMLIFLPLIDKSNFWNIKKMVVFIFISIILGSFFFQFIINRGYNTLDLQYMFSLRHGANQERINRFATALNMFRQNPLFGVGIRCYIFEYFNYKTIIYPTMHTEFQMMSSHNQYLDVLANRGIIGFILFIGLIGIFIRNGIRTFRKSNIKWKPLILGALLGNITYFIHWMTNTLWVGKLAALFWFCMAIVVIGELNIGQKRRNEK